MRSCLEEQENTFFIFSNSTHTPTHTPTHTHTHTLSLFLSLSLSLSMNVSLSLPPPYPHLFLEDDMGDPDVTFHWPMVSREGLDWCALPMPLLLKTPELLCPTQQLNSYEKEQQQGSALLNQQHHSHLRNCGGYSQLYLQAEESTFFSLKFMSVEGQKKTKSHL